MRELISDARNIRHRIVNKQDGSKELVTNIEFVLSVSNRNFVYSGASIQAQDSLETIRFESCIEGCEAFANDILAWVKDAKLEREALHLKE